MLSKFCKLNVNNQICINQTHNTIYLQPLQPLQINFNFGYLD